MLNNNVSSFLSLCLILFISHVTSTQTLSFSRSTWSLQNYKINSIHSYSKIDGKSGSCDVTMKQRISFTFDHPSNEIRYAIFSRKNSIHGFHVSKPQVQGEFGKVISTNFFSAKVDFNYAYPSIMAYAVKNLQHTGYFHESWIVVTTLDKNVTSVTLDYEYKIDKAVSIDDVNNLNHVFLSMINPYDFDIEDFEVNLILANFPVARESFHPNGAMIKYNSDDIELNYRYPFKKESEIFLSIPVPKEIVGCGMEIYKPVLVLIPWIILLLIFLTISFLTWKFK